MSHQLIVAIGRESGSGGLDIAHALAERFQLPISTIRYYEAAGLLTKVGRTTAGQRVFTEGHLNRLRTICCFKHAGMSIRQLQAFFAYEAAEPANMDAILQLLQEQKEKLEASPVLKGVSQETKLAIRRELGIE